MSDMGALVERALRASLQALVERNRLLAYSVILRDQYVDEIETELDRLCLEFLARQQPVAGHLRFVFAAAHINRELERIGDYAESIARQVLALGVIEPQPSYAHFLELGNLSVHMVSDAVRAFVQADADLGKRTMPIEERANLLRNQINAELVDLNRQGHLSSASLAPLMTVARRLERVADQARNICEEVLYMCTGEFLKHKAAEGFRILFVDLDNACLSQMAEGIARSLAVPGFSFSSAGISPKPLDSRAVQFLARKGIDLSKQTSKSVEQVPGWGSFQVVITFGAQVWEALPPQPGKTIHLTWPIPDPATSVGPAGDYEVAFAPPAEALEAHIRELIGAIRKEPQKEPPL
jgi:phosphate transport system protein